MTADQKRSSCKELNYCHTSVPYKLKSFKRFGQVDQRENVSMIDIPSIVRLHVTIFYNKTVLIHYTFFEGIGKS